jgi:hypothetical protein
MDAMFKSKAVDEAKLYKGVKRQYFERSFDLPNPGLKAYLERVRKGDSHVWTTPFAKGESTQSMLSAWASILVSISDKWPSLWNWEIDLSQKVGPMSIMKPLKQRKDDIQAYYDGVLLPSEPLSIDSIQSVVREFKCLGGLNLRSVSKTLQQMKLSTNSGSPYFTKRRRVADFDDVELYASRFGTVTQYMYKEYDDVWEAAAVLGWRGQEGGPSEDDVKQRVVWMFPFAVNVAELQLYQPAIEVIQRHGVVPAWVSMDAVDKGITKLFETKKKGDLIVCTDFSKFDQHFNPDLQNAAKTIISWAVRQSEVNTWLEEVFPIKFMIPLVIGWGKVLFGSHGMGSGSGGTNFDETLAHRALQYEAAQQHLQKLNPYSMCLGDDGIITYPGISVESVVRSYTAHGLEMNPDKQYASEQDCVYLRRWHHRHYRVGGVCAGVYSTMRALGRMRYLERYMDPEMWGPKAVALRQLSILENVKYHPLREEFVKFCMKRDKYRLGIDIPGFLDNVSNEAKKATAYMPDFLGYVRTLQSGNSPDGGIQSWWIVNYLKSLR